MRVSVVAFALVDVVPYSLHAIRTSGAENFQSSAKKDFFNIG